MQGNYSFLQQDPRFLQQQQALTQSQSQAFNQPQQPQQTGYVQQQRTGYVQPQQTSGFLPPQQTGYLPPQQGNFIQSHRTGFVQPQPTGFAPGGMMRSNQVGLSVQPQPTGFTLQPQQTSFGVQSQQTGFGIQSQSTGFPSSSQFNTSSQFSAQQPQNQGRFNSTPLGGLTAQPTGYPMGFRGMMPAIGASSQPFLNTFMPAPGTQQSIGLSTTNFQPSQMQFAQPSSQFNGMSLQQTFQQQNQQQIGQAEVKVPWKLSSEEKKSYDQIFRAWDQTGSGFIEGKMSTEVFAQSGLPREDLMQIWALADVENRGKLNLAEFHVAMGLIYRRLNGNPIPPTLPPEMVPPSARDLDNSVDFLKDLLKKDNARATGESYGQHTLGPVRSLHGARSSPNLHKDATMYKHDELDSSNTYKSRSRHLDRRSVRHAGEDKTTANLDDMKRELDRTDDMLQSSRHRDDEDSDLDHELEDLQYRIKRIQDDIEYISRSGRRSEANDQERRKLERELLRLRHEDLPELEAKIGKRDHERRKESQSYAKQRDKRNNSSRFESDHYGDSDDDDRRRDSHSDRGYLRGSYDRDIPSRASARSFRDNPSRSSYRDTPSRASAREAPIDRDNGDHGSKRSPSSPVTSMTKSPSSAATAPPTKAMTAEEKKAFIQAEAQRRIQERLRSLGLGGGSSAPVVDTSVNSRLEQEKQEAALKASKADEEAAEREKQRQIRLEEERLSRIQAEQELNAKSISNTQSAQTELTKSNTDATVSVEKEVLAEEEALLKKREEALLKEKATRMARIKQLEEEEAESRRLEQEFQEKKAMFASRSVSSQSVATKKPPPPPAPRTRLPPPGSTSGLGAQLNLNPSLPSSISPSSQPASTPTIAIGLAEESSTSSSLQRTLAPAGPVAPPAPPAPPLPQQVPQSPSPSSAPPAPPAPPAPSLTAQTTTGSSLSTNPFHRMNSSSSHETPAASTPGSFPATLSTNNPFFKTTGSEPSNVTSPLPQPAFRPPPRPHDSDDEWDAVKDKDDDDDSDEEGAATARKARQGLAEALFGGIMPSRPQSAAADSSHPPAAPAPPAAPKAPIIKAPGAPADRGMLLGEIQSGARLRKTQTNDRSGPPLAGKILETASSQATVQRHEPQHRRSVDWIGGMAADGMSSMLASNHQSNLQSHAEEPPASQPGESAVKEKNDDAIDSFDLSRSIRVRSLYAYTALRDEDLTMAENLVLIAHPSKVDEAWLYGTIEITGQSGTFPKSYVEEIKITWGKALYDYSPTSPDEVALIENKKVAVVDSSDPDWFKIEDNGKIGLVPGAYIELES